MFILKKVYLVLRFSSYCLLKQPFMLINICLCIYICIFISVYKNIIIDYFVSTYAKNMNSDGRIRISMFVHTRQIV